MQPEPVIRRVGATEYGLCRALCSGTGLTVVALLFCKAPKIQILQNTLDKLQIYHPALRSKLRYDASADSFFFVTPGSPHVKIQFFDLSSTAQILRDNHDPRTDLHRIILEHDLNNNPWSDPKRWLNGECDVLFASLYDLIDGKKFVLTLRLHMAACDRTGMVAILSEFLKEMADGGSDASAATEKRAELGQPIEQMIPNRKEKKTLWARGKAVMGYSLNALGMANLKFVDSESPRRSQVARLRMDREETDKLLSSCKARGLKLWAVLMAAGLIAVYNSKKTRNKRSEKYTTVTLMDCRPYLEPPLTCRDFGFYHSGILSSHNINGDETLWDLAKRCFDSFSNSKKNNKHFTDMADLNFLLRKAIENPHLTPSSSLRTGSISISEDPMVESREPILSEVRNGVEDYIMCTSAHGIGPSISVFDTIRDGKLDCVCVYPSPLHSREQMERVIESMKMILVEGCVPSSDG